MARFESPEEGTLGWKLWQAARRAGKTAEQIAGEVGVVPTTVRRWWKAGDPVKGKEPSGTDLSAYAVAVGVTVEELAGTGDQLPGTVLDALSVVFRGIMSGNGVAESAERAFGQPILMSEEQEDRLAGSVQVIRQVLRGLGSLSDEQLRTAIQDAYRKGRALPEPRQ